MGMQEAKQKYQSYNINKYDMKISNDLLDCRIFWARVISSENESLFTQYTKHTFYELQYALEGRICMICGDNDRVSFDESDFIVIPPDTYHQIVDGDSTGARFIMAFGLQIKDKKIKNALKALDRAEPHHASANMHALFSMILQKNYLGEPIRKQLITSLLECFLLEMIEAAMPNRTALPSVPDKALETQQRIAEIRSLIRDYNGIGIQVSDLAQRFHISERHLHRIVYEATGQSPKELINHEKMKKIEELVASTSLSLSEISELCGFSDEYAMNKFFRRYNLTNLSDFRRINRKKDLPAKRQTEKADAHTDR